MGTVACYLLFNCCADELGQAVMTHILFNSLLPAFSLVFIDLEVDLFLLCHLTRTMECLL